MPDIQRTTRNSLKNPALRIQANIARIRTCIDHLNKRLDDAGAEYVFTIELKEDPAIYIHSRACVQLGLRSALEKKPILTYDEKHTFEVADIHLCTSGMTEMWNNEGELVEFREIDDLIQHLETKATQNLDEQETPYTKQWLTVIDTPIMHP